MQSPEHSILPWRPQALPRLPGNTKHHRTQKDHSPSLTLTKNHYFRSSPQISQSLWPYTLLLALLCVTVSLFVVQTLATLSNWGQIASAAGKALALHTPNLDPTYIPSPQPH